jgi:hypothetical protein
MHSTSGSNSFRIKGKNNFSKGDLGLSKLNNIVSSTLSSSFGPTLMKTKNFFELSTERRNQKPCAAKASDEFELYHNLKHIPKRDRMEMANSESGLRVSKLTEVTKIFATNPNRTKFGVCFQTSTTQPSWMSTIF